MKGIGSLLILSAAGAAVLIYRREKVLRIRLLEELLAGLALLRRGVCTERKPLPDIVKDELGRHLAGEMLWLPLLEKMAMQPIRGAWLDCTSALPDPLDRLLAPIGDFLPLGGNGLAGCIEEARTEIAALLGDERVELTERMKICAALCFSSAGLVILIFV